MDLSTSHGDWQISIGQELAAYQSSICFRINGEGLNVQKPSGQAVKGKLDNLFRVSSLDIVLKQKSGINYVLLKKEWIGPSSIVTVNL